MEPIEYPREENHVGLGSGGTPARGGPQEGVGPPPGRGVEGGGTRAGPFRVFGEGVLYRDSLSRTVRPAFPDFWGGDPPYLCSGFFQKPITPGGVRGPGPHPDPLAGGSGVRGILPLTHPQGGGSHPPSTPPPRRGSNPLLGTSPGRGSPGPQDDHVLPPWGDRWVAPILPSK